MTPKNRYDKLNDLAGDRDQVVSDEWIQAPDGSWIRSSDKEARKLAKKGKLPAGVVLPPPEPEPEEPESPREPKRWLRRKSAADKQRDAELARHTELERLADLDRAAEAKRAEAAEQERVRLAEQERLRVAEEEREAERERERKAELQRKAEAERARAAELEREVELERARVAGLERAIEQERERQAALEREMGRKRGRKSPLDEERLLDIDRRDELESGTYWRAPEPDYATPSYSSSESSEYSFQSWSDLQPSPEPETRSWFSGEPAADPPTREFFKPAPTASKPKVRQGKVSAAARIASGAIAVGLVLATLVIGAGLNWAGPSAARVLRPFTTSGEQGEKLQLRTFTVTVQNSRAAATVQSGDTAVQTQGAWVILRVRVTANTEPTPIGYAALRDHAGRTYLATSRLAQPLLNGKRTFQPGISLEGEVVFEVPKDALDGLTAIFASRADQLGQEPLALDAMAEVDLPGLSTIDPAPVALAATEVKP